MARGPCNKLERGAGYVRWGYSATVEPLYKDTPHKDNRVSKDMDQGPDDICMQNKDNL
jgi:hypothetical protein